MKTKENYLDEIEELKNMIIEQSRKHEQQRKVLRQRIIGLSKLVEMQDAR